MAQVPYVNRDELDAEGQAIYDRIRRAESQMSQGPRRHDHGRS